MTAYEKALTEQIAYLEAELARYRHETAPPLPLPTEDDDPIAWAMRDPNFLQWRLIKRATQQETR